MTIFQERRLVGLIGTLWRRKHLAGDPACRTYRTGDVRRLQPGQEADSAYAQRSNAGGCKHELSIAPRRDRGRKAIQHLDNFFKILWARGWIPRGATPNQLAQFPRQPGFSQPTDRNTVPDDAFEHIAAVTCKRRY